MRVPDSEETIPSFMTRQIEGIKELKNYKMRRRRALHLGEEINFPIRTEPTFKREIQMTDFFSFVV
jgi:hypothetical protein